MKTPRRLPVLALAVAAALQGCATPPPPAAQADAAANFGFPLTFSPSKMDPSADPRQDFARYAGGRWLDVARIPGDSLEISGYLVMERAVKKQVDDLLEDVSRSRATAPRGSAAQKVGDFRAAGMDEARLRALGVTPIREPMERIARARGPVALAETIAALQLMTGDGSQVLGTVGSHPDDRTRTVAYVGDAGLGLDQDAYLNPANGKLRDAYVAKVAAYFEISGRSPQEASRAAQAVLALETRIARKMLSPLEMRDPAKRFARMPFAQAKALLSAIDLEAHFRALGIATGGEIVVIGAESLRERNAILAGAPIDEVRTLMQWDLLRALSPYLTPEFDRPNAAFLVAIYGKDVTAPRPRRVAGQVQSMLGHPLSQLFVEKYMTREARDAVEDMVGRVKKEFRARIEKNTWLTPQTRAEALAKLDRTRIRVGWPDRWIDYSSVDIRPDDHAGNAMRLNEFLARREIAKLGKPVVLDEFASSKYTLPIVINAAYDSSWNGIEIPAAFMQPPFFDPKADAAVNYCAMGAVIGHELTHGFDSQGRQYDGVGNVRNWWTDVDAKRFEAETGKLAKQASAFEALPGLFLNGPLEVTENLADVGGLALGYAALQSYLRDRPQDNRPIDGFTPSQRCFLSWGQLWASKVNEGALRRTLPNDGHAPGSYRMIGAAQHHPAFYEAFGIRAGDKMWLAPADRAAIW